MLWESHPFSPQLQDGGRKWEKEALGGANLFMRLVEAPEDVLFSCTEHEGSRTDILTALPPCTGLFNPVSIIIHLYPLYSLNVSYLSVSSSIFHFLAPVLDPVSDSRRWMRLHWAAG